jgi:hypothetical protein
LPGPSPTGFELLLSYKLLFSLIFSRFIITILLVNYYGNNIAQDLLNVNRVFRNYLSTCIIG